MVALLRFWIRSPMKGAVIRTDNPGSRRHLGRPPVSRQESSMGPCENC